MSRWRRIIVHADMDAFFASIEQLDHPELCGKPIVVGRDGPRSVVTTASYEARPFGVGSAMPVADAKRRCPSLIVVPPRFARYKEISRRVMETFRSFSPLVEPLSLDEAFLDMTERGGFRTPKEMGRRIKEAVYEATGGLKVSVGISTSKFAAKVASDLQKPDGLTVIHPEKLTEVLHPLPLGKLWGVGPKAEARLKSLGLRTIGDVAEASVPLLRSKVGSLAPSIRLMARGVDGRPVVPHRPHKSVSAEVTLERDLVGERQILPHLIHSAEEVSRRLRRGSLLAKGVRLKFKTADFRIRTRQTTLNSPTNHAAPITKEATELLRSIDLREPIRLVGVGAFGLSSDDAPVQGELFDLGEGGGSK